MNGHHQGLIAAYLLDGKGGGDKVGWKEISQWSPEKGVLWIHLDYTSGKSDEYIRNLSRMDNVIQDALLADETRPRVTAIGDGLMISLRGVNLNPEADPDDMVSLRFWIEKDRIITTRRRKLLSIQDICTEIENGKGPKNSGEFLENITDRLIYRMGPVIDDIEDRVGELEDQVLVRESHSLRPALASIRRQTISLRRYMNPQRDAMARLQNEKVSWLTEEHRIQLREVYDHLTRYIEDLDAARERATVTQEELVSRLSEQMDKRMYVLSIVAAIFLPLGFLTGLLGINIPGIPGAEYKFAFFVFCMFLVVIVIFELLVFKRKKWM